MLLSLDLGSRHLGLVVALPGLPLVVRARLTAAVDPANLGACVSEADGALGTGLLTGIVLEIAPRFFAPVNAKPAAITAMAESYAVCRTLADRIEVLAAARGVPCIRIARQTWAHRVVPHARGITEEQAHAGVRAHMEPASWSLLVGEHERDAAGAAVGYLLGLAAPVKAPRGASKGAREAPVKAPGPSGPSPVDRLVEAIQAHGRPIRQDVLAVRMGMTPQQLSNILPRALKTGRILRPERGTYALP